MRFFRLRGVLRESTKASLAHRKMGQASKKARSLPERNREAGLAPAGELSAELFRLGKVGSIAKRLLHGA